MHHDTQVALTERIFAHLDAGTTDMLDEVTVNPVTSYTCPERLKREWDMIRAEPILMGLSCMLAGPRSYLTDDKTGVPILLVRDAHGQARAFLNACKHRGSRLLDGAGTARPRLVCPYHAWTYDLDGSLAVVPQREGFDGFDLTACNLTELPLLEQHGLIWVRPGGGPAIDGERHLAGLAKEIANYEFGGYHHYETRRINCDMNWKAVIDTFLEPYHFTPLHNDTVAPIFVPSLCLFDPFARHLRETFARRTIEQLRTAAKSEWDLITHSAIVYVFFPNTAFVMQADHAEVWRVFPDLERPDRCQVDLEFYIPEPAETDKARGHWDRNMDLVVRTVEVEDFPTGEAAQMAWSSGLMKSVVYGRNEPALAHFERCVAEAVGAKLSGV